MTEGMLPLVAILVPLVGAGLVLALGKWPNAREAATLITGVVLFGIVWSLHGPVMNGARPELTLLEVVP